MEKTKYIVTSRGMTVRTEAENPEAAFRAAEGSMQIEGAWLHEVTYPGGVEHISPALYRWQDGGVVPIISNHKVAFFDQNWIDTCPSTLPCVTCDVATGKAPRPDKCEPLGLNVPCRPFTPQPIDMHKCVLLVGYGISRPMSVHWRKQYSAANGYKTEVWTLNNDRIPGATRHFQIHDPAKCGDVGESQWKMDDLIKQGVHIYRHDNFPFEIMRRDYYCSTADYMMAVADQEGFGIICTPGLDFAGLRRSLEAHSMRYWIGVIEGKGGIVHRSPMSMMFRHLRYGFHTEKEHYEYELEPDGRPTPATHPARTDT